MPAASAASSLVIPCAIPSQNCCSSHRPASGGRPGDRNGARPDRCDRRFRSSIATSYFRVLRRPVESALSVIVIVVTGLTLAFGDTSGGFRRLIQIVFGLSIAFAASSFFLSFFSFSGGALV